MFTLFIGFKRYLNTNKKKSSTRFEQTNTHRHKDKNKKESKCQAAFHFTIRWTTNKMTTSL